MPAKKSHPVPAPGAPPSAPESPKSQLSPDEILTAEFEYIADSAFQANEDRSKAASFFLVAVGSLVAAIFGAREISNLDQISSTLYQALGLIFLVLTIFGFLTIAQLARLRLAWYDAAVAMNKIKQYYIDHETGLGAAFHWVAGTLPQKFKVASISFYTVLEVALLSGLTGGASAYFLSAGMQYEANVRSITMIVGGAVFLLSPLSYIALLFPPVKKK